MQKYLPYLWLIGAVVALAGVSEFAGARIVGTVTALTDTPSASVLAALCLFALTSFASFYATRGTALPSFVVAIAFGVAGHTLFAPVVASAPALSALVTGSAAIILFGGGLEMPLRNFMRLLPKIALLAIPGVVVSGFALSFVAAGIAPSFGFTLSAPVVILLGAILASTDPAAIIPVLEPLRFKRRDTKDIVIAESALNDVVGTLLTSAFLVLPLASLTITSAYSALATSENMRFLTEQTLYGILWGLGGFGMLWLLGRIKLRHHESFGADQVYFLATPVIAFVGASVAGGSGFLAAFLAGLLFHAEEHMHEIERFFFQVVDGVAKPVIFLLVGALVDLHALIVYAPLGIAAGFIFMFVIRPGVVFLMIGVFGFIPHRPNGLTWRELLFISFVRETGAIPAVLLVTAVGHMAGLNGLVEIGMWVILLTLVIAPPFTPYVARKLGVAA